MTGTALSLIPVRHVLALTHWACWEGLSHGGDKPSLMKRSLRLAGRAGGPALRIGSGEPTAMRGWLVALVLGRPLPG